LTLNFDRQIFSLPNLNEAEQLLNWALTFEPGGAKVNVEQVFSASYQDDEEPSAAESTGTGGVPFFMYRGRGRGRARGSGRGRPPGTSASASKTVVPGAIKGRRGRKARSHFGIAATLAYSTPAVSFQPAQASVVDSAAADAEEADDIDDADDDDDSDTADTPVITAKSDGFETTDDNFGIFDDRDVVKAKQPDNNSTILRLRLPQPAAAPKLPPVLPNVSQSPKPTTPTLMAPPPPKPPSQQGSQIRRSALAAKAAAAASAVASKVSFLSMLIIETSIFVINRLRRKQKI